MPEVVEVRSHHDDLARQLALHLNVDAVVICLPHVLLVPEQRAVLSAADRATRVLAKDRKQRVLRRKWIRERLLWNSRQQRGSVLITRHAEVGRFEEADRFETRESAQVEFGRNRVPG